MSSTTTPEPTVDAALRDFLRQHDAEAAFRTICELARTSFPALRGLTARLGEDHDEPGWRRVFMDLWLPPHYPYETIRLEERRFDERVMEQVLAVHRPLFVLLPRRAVE
jgi:hypothetical protein